MHETWTDGGEICGYWAIGSDGQRQGAGQRDDDREDGGEDRAVDEEVRDHGSHLIASKAGAMRLAASIGLMVRMQISRHWAMSGVASAVRAGMAPSAEPARGHGLGEGWPTSAALIVGMGVSSGSICILARSCCKDPDDDPVIGIEPALDDPQAIFLERARRDAPRLDRVLGVNHVEELDTLVGAQGTVDDQERRVGRADGLLDAHEHPWREQSPAVWRQGVRNDAADRDRAG